MGGGVTRTSLLQYLRGVSYIFVLGNFNRVTLTAPFGIILVSKVDPKSMF